MVCAAAHIEKPFKNAEAAERKRPMAGVSLAQAVAALLGTCVRRLSRAARRLHLRPPRQSSSSRAIVPFLGNGGGVIKKVLSSSSKSKRRRREDDELSFEWEDDGVWRKEIIMGERCQPLDFSGAIYYDADGRRLEQPPTPRSPLRSPLPASVVLAKANAAGGH
nr:unnamed protein product [Digitaria exilis]